MPHYAPPMQLYNMKDDPREQENLYAAHPEIVARLKDLLAKYERERRSVPRRG